MDLGLIKRLFRGIVYRLFQEMFILIIPREFGLQLRGLFKKLLTIGSLEVLGVRFIILGLRFRGENWVGIILRGKLRLEEFLGGFMGGRLRVSKGVLRERFVKKRGLKCDVKIYSVFLHFWS